MRRLTAQQPRAQGVKCGDPHLAAVDAQQGFDAARISSAALLVKVTARIDPAQTSLADEICDTVRDDARFFRSRSSEDQQRTVRLENGRLLFGIERGKEVLSYSTVTLFARFLG